MNLSAKWKLIWLLMLVSLLACSCRDTKVQESIEQLIEHSNNQSTDESELDPQQLMINVLEGINSRDYGSALENLELLRSSPGHDRIWAGMSEASIEQRLGNYDRALEIIEEIRPDYYMSEMLQLRADTLESMHRLDEARMEYEQLRMITRSLTDSNVIYSLWLIAFQQGDFERIQGLEADMESRPKTDVFDQYWIYQRALMDRDFVTAGQALDRIPNLPSTTETTISSYWDPYLIIWRAELAFEQGDVDRSIETLEDMAGEYPFITDQWPELVSHAEDTGRYSYAFEASIQGIILAGGAEVLDDLEINVPDDISEMEIPDGPPRTADIAGLLVSMGNVALAGGGMDDAIRYAEAAKGLNPYLDGAYVLESVAFEINGDPESALEAAIGGLNVEPLSTSLCLRYIALASRFPSLINPDDPDPAAVANSLLARAHNWIRLYPRYPGCAYPLARAIQCTGGEGWLEYLEIAYTESPVRWQYGLAYAAGLAEVGRLDEAYDVMGGVETPTDLTWLYDLGKRAEQTGSIELAEFVEQLRERMDPEGRFAEILD